MTFYKLCILLLVFDLTGHWVQEAHEGVNHKGASYRYPEFSVVCRFKGNGKIQCDFTTASGPSSTNDFVVNGFEVLDDGDRSIVGTYDGIGTIRWLPSGTFYGTWHRRGMLCYI